MPEERIIVDGVEYIRADLVETLKLPKGKHSLLDYDWVKTMWNEAIPSRPIKRMSSRLKEKIRIRSFEFAESNNDPEEIFKALLYQIQNSQFLLKTFRNFNAEWVFDNDNNWTKIYNGNYNYGTDTNFTSNDYQQQSTAKDERDRAFAELQLSTIADSEAIPRVNGTEGQGLGGYAF